MKWKTFYRFVINYWSALQTDIDKTFLSTIQLLFYEELKIYLASIKQFCALADKVKKHLGFKLVYFSYENDTDDSTLTVIFSKCIKLYDFLSMRWQMQIWEAVTSSWSFKTHLGNLLFKSVFRFILRVDIVTSVKLSEASHKKLCVAFLRRMLKKGR